MVWALVFLSPPVAGTLWWWDETPFWSEGSSLTLNIHQVFSIDDSWLKVTVSEWDTRVVLVRTSLGGLWFIKDKLFHKSKCILVPTPFWSFGCTYTFSINPTHCFLNKAPGSGNENTPSHLSTGERQHIVIAMHRRVPTREQSACRYAAVLPKKEPKPVSDCRACVIT